MKKYGIIIDTEQYAGNFERELCAFLTGRVGDCGVGGEYQKDFDLFENVIIAPDENGDHRPCAIWPTEGWFNNGLGGHYRHGQEDLALSDHKAELVKHKTKNIESTQNIKDRLLKGENVSNWSTVAACDREIAGHKKEIKKGLAKTKVNKYPAYLSVIIYFSGPPTQEQVNHIKNKVGDFKESVRSKKVAYQKDFEFTFTGLRLYKETITKEVTPL